MAVCIEGFEKPSELLVKLMRKELNEAERRGYERARAECAADTRRLEWLERQSRATMTDRKSSRVLFHSPAIGPWGDLRSAIDAAMEGGGNDRKTARP